MALSPVALSPDALPPKAVTLVAQGYSLNTDWTEESLYYKLKKKFYLRDGRLTQRERRDLLKIRRKELMKQRQQQLNRARFGLG